MTTPIPDMTPLGGATLLLSRMSRLLPEDDRDRKYAQQIIEQLDAFQSQLAAVIDRLHLELEGERKARELLSAGMGSVCDDRDAMKMELRELRERVGKEQTK